MMNYAVRMSSEIETNVVSVERIKEYADVPQVGPSYISTTTAVIVQTTL